MTMARRLLVDSTVTPYDHCISRCVRRAFLYGDGCEHRKQWIEDCLKELAGIFAVDVAGFAVLDNHLHVVLLLNDAMADGWTDEEVVRRWGRLFPPRGKNREPLGSHGCVGRVSVEGALESVGGLSATAGLVEPSDASREVSCSEGRLQSAGSARNERRRVEVPAREALERGSAVRDGVLHTAIGH